MSEYKLPMGDFKELTGDDFDNFINQDLLSLDVNSDVGYYIYLDIKPISPSVIQISDEFPLLLSPMNIKESDLSKRNLRKLNEHNLKLPSNNVKLVAHHTGVKNYLITLPLLKFLIKQERVNEKIHKVYEFKHGHFLTLPLWY